MNYTVRLKKQAEKSLKRIPASDRKKILNDLLKLEKNPFLPGVEKLQGVDGYRLRAGDYRILFTFDKMKRGVFVFRIKHRKDVYRFF